MYNQRDLKMKMRLVLFVLAFALFNVSEARASECYSLKDAEAEQGIRIHSELMVIGLNCQHMYSANGQNLYMAYRDFTEKHSRIFASYERRLLMFFERTSGDQAESKLNELRTSFANKISTDAATMRPDIFCNKYAGRIVQVANVDDNYIRRWAGTFYEAHPVSRPMCQ
jgi:hypothetical protein